MDEEEFDKLMPWRPFGTKDVARAEARMRRCAKLGVALWGTTSAHLQLQLTAPHPKIPSGFELDDFRTLLRDTRAIAAKLSDPRNAWLARVARSGATVFAGAQTLTEWEARCEIVRRAIEYLAGR